MKGTTDRVREAIWQMPGDFTTDALLPLLPGMEGRLLRQALWHLDLQGEIRRVVVEEGESPTYRRAEKLVPAEVNSRALAIGGAFLQALALAWGAQRPRDSALDFHAPAHQD